MDLRSSPAFFVLGLALSLTVGSIDVVSGNYPSYIYSSPPPPAPYHHPKLVLKVVGKVYCYGCYDWSSSVNPHDRKYLQGAVVKVTCMEGRKEVVAYGKTEKNGEYNITVDGYDVKRYGADDCKAMLHAPPFGSPCNVPTNLHDGNVGAKLHLKTSPSDGAVVYKAKNFAYAPLIPDREECTKIYHHSPPPSPSPVFKVVGKVYCYRCYDWIHPDKSHNKKHLEGAVVKVTCKAAVPGWKDTVAVAYGKTKDNGKYAITVEGYDVKRYGAENCKAMLHLPPKGSPCSIPTDLHHGDRGEKLRVKSENSDEVVYEAENYAYGSIKPYKECQDQKLHEKSSENCKNQPLDSHHRDYKYNSPPSPPLRYSIPPYYYHSPPASMVKSAKSPPPTPMGKPPPNLYYYSSPPPPPIHK